MKLGIHTSGFDKLQRQLTDAQRAIKSLDGPIAKVKIDPADPASLKRAIRDMEAAVDRKVAPYKGNALVATVAEATKKHFREELTKRAA